MSESITVLVTGANRGIGLALARVFAERGDRVIGTARKPLQADDLAAAADRVEALDVTGDESVAALAASLDGETVDLLVHNAGILVKDGLDDVDPADVLRQIDVNAVGPLRVTRALRPHLERAAKRARKEGGPVPRLVFLSSVMGSIGDNDSGGYYGYRSSKAALNAVIRNLHLDLEPWPSVALHPGYVHTGMTGAGDITPEESAGALVEVMDRVDRSMSGRFFDRFGEEIPW